MTECGDADHDDVHDEKLAARGCHRVRVEVTYVSIRMRIVTTASRILRSVRFFEAICIAACPTGIRRRVLSSTDRRGSGSGECVKEEICALCMSGTHLLAARCYVRRHRTSIDRDDDDVHGRPG